jgi:hypothetical protein
MVYMRCMKTLVVIYRTRRTRNLLAFILHVIAQLIKQK